MSFEQDIHGGGVYAFRARRGRAGGGADSLAAPLRLALVLMGLATLGACASPQIVASRPALARPPVLALDHARMDDGYRLPLQVWSGGPEPAIVLLGLHGFNDHARAFAPLGEDLARLGITTYAPDQRGFGASAQAGRWHGSDRLAADLRLLIGQLRARHPDARLHVAGESMGGAVVLAALAHGPLPVDGLILIAPAVWSRDTMPWYQRLVLEGAVRTLPWLKLTGEGIRLSPSDHIEMLRAMSADPRVIKATRVDALWGITELMDRAQTAAPHLQTPALILYGERDEIIPRNAFCRFIAKLPRDDPALDFVLYREGWHMLPRDLQGERVRTDIAVWMRHPGMATLPSGEGTGLDSTRVRDFCHDGR